MPRRWRSRAVKVVLPLTTARAIWGRAWRVDHRWDAARGWHVATVLLCAEERAPVGWCRLLRREGAETAVLDRIAWDAGREEADAWAALEALAGGPVTSRRSG